MDLQKLLERIPADREEVLQAAVQCATAEELLALARSQGIELTPQEAGELLALIHPRAGELSPDELDAVTGGSGDVCQPGMRVQDQAVHPLIPGWMVWTAGLELADGVLELCASRSLLSGEAPGTSRLHRRPAGVWAGGVRYWAQMFVN